MSDRVEILLSFADDELCAEKCDALTRRIFRRKSTP